MISDTQQHVRFLGPPMPRRQAEALAAAISEAGWPVVVAASAFEAPEHDATGGAACWQVEVFCDVGAAEGLWPDGKTALQTHLDRLAALTEDADISFSLAPLPEVDWVAHVQQGLRPVHAGRFLVHGAHDRQQRKPFCINIEMEAGQAFGTGHHGTTQGCLLALDWLLRQGRLRACGKRSPRVLDVGTGSGVLGIAAMLALKARVVATDIDAVAVHIARHNAVLNGAPEMRLRAAAGARHPLVRQMAGGRRLCKRQYQRRPGLALMRQALRASRVPFPSYLRRQPLHIVRACICSGGGYDLVFANILARPLMRMAHELTLAVRPGGWLVLSGLLHSQERMVLAVYEQQAMQLVRRWQIDGWSTLLLRGYRRMARQMPESEQFLKPLS